MHGAEEGVDDGRGDLATEDADVESTEISGSTGKSSSSSEIGIDSGDLAAYMMMENAKAGVHKVEVRSRVIVDSLKNEV